MTTFFRGNESQRKRPNKLKAHRSTSKPDKTEKEQPKRPKVTSKPFFGQRNAKTLRARKQRQARAMQESQNRGLNKENLQPHSKICK